MRSVWQRLRPRLASACGTFFCEISIDEAIDGILRLSRRYCGSTRTNRGDALGLQRSSREIRALIDPEFDSVDHVGAERGPGGRHPKALFALHFRDKQAFGAFAGD